VLPVTAEVLDRARGLLDEYGRLMARDALHAAFVPAARPLRFGGRGASVPVS